MRDMLAVLSTRKGRLMSKASFVSLRLLGSLVALAVAGCGSSGAKVHGDAGSDVLLPPLLDPGATLLTAVLPSPRHEPAVFSDGNSVFVAGGMDDKNTLLAEIVRFDPRSGAVTVLPDVLPTPRYATGVAWSGDAAYLVGGLDKSGALAQIVRYSPSTGTATVMAAQLPIGIYNAGVVWADGVIYIAGGMAGVHRPQILRYDPSSDTITSVAAMLPVGVEEPAVFWDGAWVWVLGGKADAAGTTGAASSAVQVFDPMSGEASTVGSLPYAVWGSPAFTDGDMFYLPGGSATTSSGYASIVAFDFMAESGATLDFALPVQVGGRTGTWVESMWAGYICGGADPRTGKPSDKIIQVVP
jgi:hypothetical protein